MQTARSNSGNQRNNVLNVRDYGAKGDGITDDSAALRATVAALPADGGFALIPPGDYLMRTTLTISKDNVSLVGAGASSQDAMPATPASKLTWDGKSGGTMIAFHAISARTGKQIRGGGLQHLCLDNQDGLGGIGIDIRSQAFGIYADLLILQPGIYGISLGVVQPPLTDHRVTQNCTFDNVRILAPSSGGRCLYMTGDPLANPSYNVFRNLLLTAYRVEEILIEQGDNNVFYDVRCFHTGAGKSITLWLNGTMGPNGYVTANQFHHTTASAGVEQKGGATQNAFYEYDRSQGFPAPTITAGQLLYTESQLGGGAWHLPVELYAKFHAQTSDATQAAGLNLFDERDTFVGNLAVRNSRNPVFPGTIALVSQSKDVVFARFNGSEYVEAFRLPLAGGAVVGAAPLAAGAQDGFLYVPAVSGTPTGPPTSRPGTVPLCIDTRANRLWAFFGGAWKSASFT